MADRPLPISLDVRGELNTAYPVGDMPPGTLVAAPDVAHRALGPRRGSGAFTQAMEGPGTASLYDAITLNGTNNARGLARTYEDAFGDLGTKFTLDLWFRLEATAYASAVNRVGVYAFNSSGSGAGIDVNVFGGAHSDHERIEVRISTSPTRATAASVVAFTGATRLLAGTTQTHKQHVRVVRDGANGYLYLNGVLDGSTSGLAANDPINKVYGYPCDVLLGTSETADISFLGHVYGAWLRDGAFATQPVEARMPHAPFARNVHHAYVGRSIALGGDVHFFDAGRFGAHARLIANSGADYSVTSSKDNAAPAPCLVQGLKTWTTRTGRTATSVMVGGQLCTAGVS